MSDSILEFWTPERLREAIPEKPPEPFKRPDPAPAPAAPEVNSDPSFVPDDDLPRFPFQSIGRLFFSKNGNPYTGSAAFVVHDSNAIVTSAHNLISGNGAAQNILFIPAMIDIHDVNGQHFGVFPQIAGGQGVAWAVDRQWNPGNPDRAYDIGFVRMGPRGDGKTLSQVVTPIGMLVDQINTAQTEWLTVGYPVQESNPRVRMMMQEGSFQSQARGVVTKFGDGLLGGTSGGPWLRAGANPAMTNGIHSGSEDPGVTSVSPYLTLAGQARLWEQPHTG
jgi:hypothetical protein